MPAKLHVGLLFILQLMFFLIGFGAVLTDYHRRGYSLALLIPVAIAATVVFHVLLGGLGRMVPVRCTGCSARAGRFQGFGWWPFVYRYACRRCGAPARYDVSG